MKKGKTYSIVYRNIEFLFHAIKKPKKKIYQKTLFFKNIII